MKIEKINSFLVRDQFIVEIITDKGISGIGQSACWAYPEAVKSIVDRFDNILIGKDPFMIEEINQLLMRTGPFRGSVLSGAISCIDIALWDIKAKFFETPIKVFSNRQGKGFLKIILGMREDSGLKIKKFVL